MIDALGSEFEVLSEVGRGGMGVVYKARQISLDRIVAIKMLLPGFSDKDEFIRRFKREARSVATLKHPNIVEIHDIRKAGDTWFIIAEFLEGGTLKDLLRRQRVLAIDEATRILCDVCSALFYTHNKGIVHRDIKPDNVMFTEDKRVKVTDFGLARLAESSFQSRTGMVMGSPSYMSPEQGSGKTTDHRTDIYALGAMFFQMVTGRVPFQADNALALIYMHVHEKPPFPSKIHPGLPQWVDRVIHKCLEKSPGERYQDCEGLGKALEEAISTSARISGSTAPARRDSRVKRGGVGPNVKREGNPRVRKSGMWMRWPTIAGALGVLVILLLLIPRPSKTSAPDTTPLAVELLAVTALGEEGRTPEIGINPPQQPDGIDKSARSLEGPTILNTSVVGKSLRDKGKIPGESDAKAMEAVEKALAAANAEVIYPSSPGLPYVEEGNMGAVWRSLYDSLKGTEIPELRRIISLPRKGIDSNTTITHVKAIAFLCDSLRMDEGKAHAESVFAQLLLYDVFDPWAYIVKKSVDEALNELAVPLEKKNEMVLDFLRCGDINRARDLLAFGLWYYFVPEAARESTRIALVALLASRSDLKASDFSHPFEKLTSPDKRVETVTALLQRLERSPSEIDGVSLHLFKLWNVTDAIPRLRQLRSQVSGSSAVALVCLLVDMNDKVSAPALHAIVEQYRYGNEASQLHDVLSRLITVEGGNAYGYVAEVLKRAKPNAQVVLLGGCLKGVESKQLQTVVEELSQNSDEPMVRKAAAAYLGIETTR